MLALIHQLLSQYKFYRLLNGGLWIRFNVGGWVSFTWIDREAGLIRHPQGGEFHRNFNAIEELEDYDWNNHEEKDKES